MKSQAGAGQPVPAGRVTGVLVVEDDAGQRQTLIDILRPEALDVRGCGSLAVARELIGGANGIGVVVLDLDLPDGNGMQLLREIQAADESLLIVINTGQASFDTARDAVNNGAFAYVEKAGDPEELLRHVQRAQAARLSLYAGTLEAAVDEHSARLHAANETLQQQALEQEQLQARLEQAQKLESVGTLASGIAHDFNNILTVIQGYTELAERGVQDELVRQDLSGVQEAVQQAIELTRSLLMFAGGGASSRRTLRVDRILRIAIRMLRRLLPATIFVAEHFEKNELWIEANQAQLQQVFLNLALNAVDALDESGTITFGCRARHGQVEIMVSDDGPGISPEVLDRVFDPFFTTKAKGQGTGLGLAMVHGIVRDHGGEVRIDSEPGQGTHVTLTLPSVQPDEFGDPFAGVDLFADHSGGTILLAEDNLMVSKLVQSTLTQAGYRVIAASDGIEALELHAEHAQQIQLLLCDIDLPGLSGDACVGRVRAHQPDLPAILISGRPWTAPDGALSDAVFLPKPFGTRELLDIVAQQLARAQT